MFDARAVLGIILYFKEKILKPLRTDLDIGAEKSETITVSGFFLANFQSGTL